MYLEITKQHKSNKGRTLTVCNYGYFRKNKEWEALALNLLGRTSFYSGRKATAQTGLYHVDKKHLQQHFNLTRHLSLI